MKLFRPKKHNSKTSSLKSLPFILVRTMYISIITMHDEQDKTQLKHLLKNIEVIVKPWLNLMPKQSQNSKSLQNHSSNAQIIIKLWGKVPMGILDPVTPSPAPSGPSRSSKTPGKDFDDRCSLDKLPDVGSRWNFQWSYPGIFRVLWHHH